MEEADSHTVGPQSRNDREGATPAENRESNTENVGDDLADSQNPSGEEGEGGNDEEYIKDGYYMDGYDYDHDPNLLRVTKALEITEVELVEQRELTAKMKKMTKQL
uniref:Uncharacterized protein n=1 Tax=Cannabis sativa TaxID=3483 RepID=A0A803PC93_CANSA